MNLLQQILKLKCSAMEDLSQAVRGQFLIVKHEDSFKRGKIIEEPDEDDASFWIYLIDFGSTIQAAFADFFVIKLEDAFRYTFELPPQCYECRLSEVIPSAIKCSSGWSEKSTEEFKKFIDKKSLQVEVVSFVDEVANVYLLAAPAAPGTADTLNEHMLLLGFAQNSDDSYLSRVDEIAREKTGHNVGLQKLEDKLVDETFAAPPEGVLTEKIKLDGPYSPLEGRLYGLCREKLTGIAIEASSVNSVLFDPYPFDGKQKLLVAASMSKRDQKVVLHQTTMMPHLPGMATLLSLIFGPIAEVRCSDKKQRYTSVLAGLGCDANFKPFYGEHDCLIDIDVELSEQDFCNINELRSQMSYVSRQQPGQMLFGREKLRARDRICFLLNEIFPQERSPLGINREGKSWKWNTTADTDLEDEGLYPSLVPMEKLVPISVETRNMMKRHAQELEAAARTNQTDEHIKCRFCEEDVDTCIDLQIHVKKNLHKKRWLRIRDETM